MGSVCLGKWVICSFGGPVGVTFIFTVKNTFTLMSVTKRYEKTTSSGCVDVLQQVTAEADPQIYNYFLKLVLLDYQLSYDFVLWAVRCHQCEIRNVTYPPVFV